MAMIKCPECGTDVSDAAVACPKCGYGVKQHVEKEVRAAREAERRKIRMARAEERNKKLKVIIPVVSAVVVGLSIVSAYCYTMSQRMTFETEAEMKEYLEGDWEATDSKMSMAKVCRVKDDVLERINTDVEFYNYAGDIEYFPERGYIKVNGINDSEEKYIVKKNGTLNFKMDKFEKIPTEKYEDVDAFVDAIGFYEDGETELSEDGILTVKGKAANLSNRGYHIVMFKVDVMNGEDVVKSSMELVNWDNGDYVIGAGESLGYMIQEAIGNVEYDAVQMKPVAYRSVDDDM